MADLGFRRHLGLKAASVGLALLLWFVASDTSSTKVVPIVPSIEGEPALGFVIGEVSADPSTVELVGPASALQTVTAAVTETVSVAGISENLAEQVLVGSPDVAVRLRAPLRTRVSVSIVYAPVEWAVAGVPVKVVGGSLEGPPMPATVTVELRGPREAVTSRLEDFEATVNVTGFAPGELLVPVRVVAPEGVAIVKVEPPELRLRVR
jgi:YbbR domain-containing protein